MKTLEELQVGKWYQDTSWYSKKDYAKFEEVEIGGMWDQLWHSENISDGNYTKRDNFCHFTISTLREVPLEEIQEFLPDGHPDKMVKKSLVGRYVKCLRNGANYCLVAKKEVKEGEYYKIDSIEIDSYKLKDGNYCGVINKPDSQFKGIGFELMPEGFTPPKELTELPEKWCIKDIPEVKSYFEEYNNGNYTCSNDAYLHYPRINMTCYFRTVQPEYTEITLEQFKKWVLKEDSSIIQSNLMTNNKFKVGDKVRIPVSKQGNLWYKNNISELDDYHKDYFIISGVRSHDNIGLNRDDTKVFRENSFCESDLVLYTEPTKEEWIPKVGDWVWDTINKKCLRIKDFDRFGDLILEEQGNTYKSQCRKAEPWEIPTDEQTTTISIVDMSMGKLCIDSQYIHPTIPYAHFSYGYGGDPIITTKPLTPKESFKINKLPTKSWY